MCQKPEPLQWEGEEISAAAKGPGFGQPIPKLEDRFPAEEVAKLREQQKKKLN